MVFWISGAKQELWVGFFSGGGSISSLCLGSRSFIVNRRGRTPRGPGILAMTRILRGGSRGPMGRGDANTLSSLGGQVLGTGSSSGSGGARTVGRIFAPGPRVGGPRPMGPTRRGAPPSSASRAIFPGGRDRPRPRADSGDLLRGYHPCVLSRRNGSASHGVGPSCGLRSITSVLEGRGRSRISSFGRGCSFRSSCLKHCIRHGLRRRRGHQRARLRGDTRFPGTRRPSSSTAFAFAGVGGTRAGISFAVSSVSPVGARVPRTRPRVSGSAVAFAPVASNRSLPGVVMDDGATRVSLANRVTMVRSVSSGSPAQIRLRGDRFSRFMPPCRVGSSVSTGHFLEGFSLGGHGFFLVDAVSTFLAFLLVVVGVPFVSNIILSRAGPAVVVYATILNTVAYLGCSVFLSLQNVFGGQDSTSMPTTLSTIFMLVCTVVNVLGNRVIASLYLLYNVSLAFHTVNVFRGCSCLLSGLGRVSMASPGGTMALLGSRAIAFTVTGGSVRNSALVTSPGLSGHVSSCVGFSACRTFLGNGTSVVAITSLLLSMVTFFTACGCSSALFCTFCTTTIVRYFASLPSVFLVSGLPLCSTTGELGHNNTVVTNGTNTRGVRLTGTIILGSSSLFPANAIALRSVGILSPGSVTRAVLRTTTLAGTLRDPLCPIFVKVTNSRDVLPRDSAIGCRRQVNVSN